MWPWENTIGILTVNFPFSLIALLLERRSPSEEGYGTIFPLEKHGGPDNIGENKAFSRFSFVSSYSPTFVLGQNAGGVHPR